MRFISSVNVPLKDQFVYKDDRLPSVLDDIARYGNLQCRLDRTMPRVRIPGMKNEGDGQLTI